MDIISTWIAGLALLGSDYYIIVIAGFAYAGWDRLIRKKYNLHLVQPEGEMLTEVKQYSKPMSWAGKDVDYKKNGSIHKIDPEQVLFIDRYNKRHIVQSVTNVFSFHPITDENNKLKLITIAKASAQNLHETISKKGFMTKLNGLVASMGQISRGQMAMFIVVGVSIALVAVQMFPSQFGLQHIVSSSITTTTSTTASVPTLTGVH